VSADTTPAKNREKHPVERGAISLVACFMALAAECNEILEALRSFSDVRAVVSVEVLAATAVLTETARAVERGLPALSPSFAAQVSAVLALPLLARSAPALPILRFDVAAHRADDEYGDDDQRQLRADVNRRLLLCCS
jgi:hypothetical protein